jgi:hypothetical protein
MLTGVCRHWGHITPMHSLHAFTRFTILTFVTLLCTASRPSLNKQVDDQSKSAAKLAVHLLKQPQQQQQQAVAVSGPPDPSSSLDRSLSLGLGTPGSGNGVDVQGLVCSRGFEPGTSLASAGGMGLRLWPFVRGLFVCGIQHCLSEL